MKIIILNQKCPKHFLEILAHCCEIRNNNTYAHNNPILNQFEVNYL